MPAKIEIHNTLTPARKVYAYCDFDDFFYIRKHRWYYDKRNSRAYPMAHIEDKSFDTKMTSKRRTLGNFIMNPSDGYEVNYLDNDPFNCVRENMVIEKKLQFARSVRIRNLNRS